MKMSVSSLACQQSVFQRYHTENIINQSFTHKMAAKASWHWNYVTVTLCITGSQRCILAVQWIRLLLGCRNSARWKTCSARSKTLSVPFAAENTPGYSMLIITSGQRNGGNRQHRCRSTFLLRGFGSGCVLRAQRLDESIVPGISDTWFRQSAPLRGNLNPFI